MLKVGDKLVCRHIYIPYVGCPNNYTTLGKTYTILRIVEMSGFVILDDNNDNCWFNLNYFDQWFYTVKELRRDKLKKIQNVEN